MKPYFAHPPFYFMPILHYNMECAQLVRLVFCELQPDCVAVELPENLHNECLHAAARLPDLTCIVTKDALDERKILFSEPCDASFEGLRSAQEAHIPAYCIDLNVHSYPQHLDNIPDPYSISRIGLTNYMDPVCASFSTTSTQDQHRETYMAKRLKELSFSYEKILVIIGANHYLQVVKNIHQTSFPDLHHTPYADKKLISPTADASCAVMAECGWITTHYEQWRSIATHHKRLDRQQLIYHLLKRAIGPYEQDTRLTFPNWGLSLIMKYARRYATIRNQLLPDFFQLISACKNCIDHNYAYEVWKCAVEYPLRTNIDGLEEMDVSVKDVWNASKSVWFHKKQPSRKSSFLQRKKREKSAIQLAPLSPFTICSYPPEDGIIETFGKTIQKKASITLQESGAKSTVFTASLEDGIDVRETIRHFAEKKTYVKTFGRPFEGVGSVVVIFHEDCGTEEKYPWKLTWLGEHAQESDMAFFASDYQQNLIGPGIARCEYGGFLLSYPPRRMYDVWSDIEYATCTSKVEILSKAAVDYSTKSVIAYVAAKAPTANIKQYAARQGKKILFHPLTQFSRYQLQKIRTFHVLDSYLRRDTANEYIND